MNARQTIQQRTIQLVKNLTPTSTRREYLLLQKNLLLNHLQIARLRDSIAADDLTNR